jgi:hypothetical protein
MRHFRSIGTAWRENLGERPAAPPLANDEEMPRGQVIALLQMRVRKAGADSLYAKVLTYLRAVGSDEPDAVDYTKLRETHYIRFDGTARLDVLLPPGMHAAERIAKAMAIQFQIHHVTFHYATPRNNMGSFAYCSCGHFRQTVSRKRGDDVRLARIAALHLDLVKSGEFKPKRPVEDFINEIMPIPELPFERRT